MEPDGKRVVALLRELAALTSDSSGAQRVAWTATWQRARAFLKKQLAGLPVTVDTDPAGNLWARLPGGSGGTLVIGSHLDSVVAGGWLDGAYGVMCALEVIRVLATDPDLPCSVALVDWADEEGCRFGRSLFGSAAVAGTLDVARARELTDAAGLRLADVVSEYGVDLGNLSAARQRLAGAFSYLEAHIEQGPVLERTGVPIAAVTGTVGIERHRVTFSGQASHAGSTPMDLRRDPFLAACTTALAVRESARQHGGVATVGSVSLQPGIVTAVAGSAVILIDQRHPDQGALTTMLAEARHASGEAARSEGCTVTWEPVFQVRPQPFDDDLVHIIRAICKDMTGSATTVPSWALHDATEMAAVVPTAMVFTSSTGGISHARQEDTPEEHLRLGVEAFYLAIRSVLARAVS